MLKRVAVAILPLLMSLAVAGQAYGQSPDLAAAGLQNLVTQLDLSSQQREQVNALISKYSENAAVIRNRVIKLQAEMKAIDLAALDKQRIQQLSADTGRYSAQFTEQTLLLQSGFYAILTPQQRQRFNQLRSEASQRRAGQ